MKQVIAAVLALCSCAAAEELFYTREGRLYVLGTRGPELLLRAEDTAVSPDGKTVAYVSGRHMHLWDRVSGRTRAIPVEAGRVTDLCWSRDSSRLAYLLRPPAGPVKVELIITGSAESRTVESRAVSQGVPGMPAVLGLSCMPDGASYLLHDLVRVAVMDGGGTVRRVFQAATVAGRESAVSSADRFVPSPLDPSLIAFTRAVPGTMRFESRFREPSRALFTYHLERKERKRLTPPDLTAADPVWSPDGAYIYFAGFRDSDLASPDRYRVFRVSAAGGEVLEIVRGQKPQVR